MAIPAGIWSRLARLDRRCNIEMRREDVPGGGVGRGTGRLYDRSAREGQAVVCEGPALVQALGAAIEDAERRGWAVEAV